ncbi:MAG TPA: DUF3830 family protein [Rubrivivax sp.]
MPDAAQRAMSATPQPRTLRVVIAGEVFSAALNPEAPLTVAAFVKLLPYRQKMIHVRWSGEACWIPLGEFQLGVGFENHTSHPAPGDVLFYPGGYSETELLIAYGACSFASRMGPLAGNHFMTLLASRDRLRALGRRVLWEGAVDVLFEADDASGSL